MNEILTENIQVVFTNDAHQLIFDDLLGFHVVFLFIYSCCAMDSKVECYFILNKYWLVHFCLQIAGNLKKFTLILTNVKTKKLAVNNDKKKTSIDFLPRKKLLTLWFIAKFSLLNNHFCLSGVFSCHVT